MIYKQGIGAAEGLAIGKAFHYIVEEVEIEKHHVTDSAEECKRFMEAVEASRQEITEIMYQTETNIGIDEANIFASHLLILEDVELIDPIKNLIMEEKVNAQFAVQTVATSIIIMFNGMDNEYLKERALDIYDVKRRIIAHLNGQPIVDLSTLVEPIILVAHDLTPSDTATLNPKYVKAIITEIGGKTSHTAIIAKSLNIPAIVGLENALHAIPKDLTLIANGTTGQCIIDPTPDILHEHEQLIAIAQQEKQLELQYLNVPTATKDGYSIELAANIASPSDAEIAIQNSAEGIGLFRTEFIYMGHNSLPSEEEQFNHYKKVLQMMGNKPVVVRTFDIGGDKELPYLKLPSEQNPFLGYRAIRISLDRPEIFSVQLRALLRASVYGNLHIMFPMIATLEELQEAKRILAEEKKKLLAENIAVADTIAVGMMIEIPSVAVIADLLADEVDFFSIGTNDLIQYTLAADRMNDKVSYLYQPFHPAIIRLIQQVVKTAHEKNIWVGVCGEMASDPLAAALLVGLGIDELSMSASSILRIRKLLAQFTKVQLTEMAHATLHMKTATEILDHLAKQLQHPLIECRK